MKKVAGTSEPEQGEQLKKPYGKCKVFERYPMIRMYGRTCERTTAAISTSAIVPRVADVIMKANHLSAGRFLTVIIPH